MLPALSSALRYDEGTRNAVEVALYFLAKVLLAGVGARWPGATAAICAVALVALWGTILAVGLSLPR